jgi:hypothetical protein
MDACTPIMDGEREESLKLVASMLLAGEQISLKG